VPTQHRERRDRRARQDRGGRWRAKGLQPALIAFGTKS